MSPGEHVNESLHMCDFFFLVQSALLPAFVHSIMARYGVMAHTAMSHDANVNM